MTSEEEMKLKLKILQEFQGLNFTLVEIYKFIDDLKGEISKIAVEQELEKLNIGRKK